MPKLTEKQKEQLERMYGLQEKANIENLHEELNVPLDSAIMIHELRKIYFEVM